MVIEDMIVHYTAITLLYIWAKCPQKFTKKDRERSFINLFLINFSGCIRMTFQCSVVKKPNLNLG